jgi:hypothetical protein
MTTPPTPQSPPPDRRNSALFGALVCIVFNVALLFVGISAARSPIGSLLRNLLLLGNLIIPVVALVKGWGRFAAGWAVAIGITIVGLAGLCFYALGNI